MRHIEGDKGRLLYSPDGQIVQFFFAPELPASFPKEQEESIIKGLKVLDRYGFSDQIIWLNHTEIAKTQKHINELKQSWVESTIIHVIQHIDPAFQFTETFAFMNDETRRKEELQKLVDAEASGEIFDMLAIGMCGYIQNNFDVPLNPNKGHIDTIKARFRPIFYLQMRIIKKYFSDGYNHNSQRKTNDIIDYLICTGINPDLIFVTNEINNLKKFLEADGATNVMTLAEYLKSIGLNKLPQKLKLPAETI